MKEFKLSTCNRCGVNLGYTEDVKDNDKVYCCFCYHLVSREYTLSKIDAFTYKCSRCNIDMPCFKVSYNSLLTDEMPIYCPNGGKKCDWVRITDDKELKELSNNIINKGE